MVQSGEDSDHGMDIESTSINRERERGFLPSIGRKPRKRTKRSEVDYDIGPLLSSYLRQKKKKEKKHYNHNSELEDEEIGSEKLKMFQNKNSSKAKKLRLMTDDEQIRSLKKRPEVNIANTEKKVKYDKFP